LNQKNSAEQLINETNKQLNEHKANLSEDNQNNIKNEIKNLQTLLDGSEPDPDAVNSAMTQLRDVVMKNFENVYNKQGSSSSSGSQQQNTQQQQPKDENVVDSEEVKK